MKRLISANPSEVLQMTAVELKRSIQASEGRVVMSENVVIREAFVEHLTNAEIARAFGADLILLNCFDVFNPFVYGLDSAGEEVVRELHRLVRPPIGVHLQPIDSHAEMLEETQTIVPGRTASRESFERLDELGFDFVCLTGNPGTGVSNQEILAAVHLANKYFSGLVIAGKMHGAGVNEPVADKQVTQDLLAAGADIILVPAVGTVPGFLDDDLREIVKLVHAGGGLVMSAIGTSQETSDVETIREIALRNKIAGVDIQHIGDAGYGGLAVVDNIYALSNTIRGVRHTVSRMARSVNR